MVAGFRGGQAQDMTTDITTFLDPADTMTPGDTPRPRSSRAPRHGLLSPRSWAELLYTLVDLAPAIAFFVLIVTLLSVGLGLAIIYVGVPIIALGLLVARFGGQVQRAMALAFLDMPTPPPGSIRPRKRGPIGAMVGVMADGACWRAVCYFVIKIALAPVTFGLALGFYSAGLGAVTYPMWRPYLPEQAASDGSLHRGAQWWPDFFVDTWPRMIFLAVLGLGVLWLAPRVVRFLTTIDRILIVSLLTGDADRADRADGADGADG